MLIELNVKMIVSDDFKEKDMKRIVREILMKTNGIFINGVWVNEKEIKK